MIAKLALGAAQFGQRYGVANAAGQATLAEIAAILDRARGSGMDTLDTAIAYGNSETCLGSVGVSSWRVITKLPALPDGIADVEEWVISQVSASLQRLGIQQLEAVLLHRPADSLGIHSEAYRNALKWIKSAGLTRSVGVSIYDPVELPAIFEVWRPDVVQAPCNVLDRRLMHSGWLERLYQSRIRVHSRSAFLQGLLLMSSASRPDWFSSRANVLNKWLGWCKDNGVSPLHAALNFVRAQPGIECVVVGVDSAAHLDEILSVSLHTAMSPPEDLFSNDRDLIDPSRWKLS